MGVSFLVTLLLRVFTISWLGGIGGEGCMGMYIVAAVLASLVLLTMVLVVCTELHRNPFLLAECNNVRRFNMTSIQRSQVGGRVMVFMQTDKLSFP